jgi:hypothetical protein
VAVGNDYHSALPSSKSIPWSQDNHRSPGFPFVSLPNHILKLEVLGRQVPFNRSFSLFFGGIGVWTQGFVFAKTGILSLEPHLCVALVILEMRSWELFVQPWTGILPISAFQVARIIGTSHWHPAGPSLTEKGNASQKLRSPFLPLTHCIEPGHVLP